jgi:ABC-2 type transport system permease protein
MAPYLALIRLAFRQQFEYRLAALAGLTTNLFFGMLRAAVMVALFEAPGVAEASGLSVRQAVTYTGLTQALSMALALWGWMDLARAIRTGEVAADLQRPVDFYVWWGAQDAGRALAQLVLRALPIMAVYAAFYPLIWPPTAWHALAFALSLTLAVSLSYAWRFLVTCALFWNPDALGVLRSGYFLPYLLSGFLLPLDLLPGWLEAGLRALPFAAIVSAPVEVYLGVVPLAGLGSVLLWQAAWTLALSALAYAILHAARQRLAVFGG